MLLQLINWNHEGSKIWVKQKSTRLSNFTLAQKCEYILQFHIGLISDGQKLVIIQQWSLERHFSFYLIHTFQLTYYLLQSLYFLIAATRKPTHILLKKNPVPQNIVRARIKAHDRIPWSNPLNNMYYHKRFTVWRLFYSKWNMNSYTELHTLS